MGQFSLTKNLNNTEDIEQDLDYNEDIEEDFDQGCYSDFFTSRNLTSECLETLEEQEQPGLPQWALAPLLLLLLLTLVANLLVVVAWWCQPSLRTPHNLHILSLATAGHRLAVVLLWVVTI